MKHYFVKRIFLHKKHYTQNTSDPLKNEVIWGGGGTPIE